MLKTMNALKNLTVQTECPHSCCLIDMVVALNCHSFITLTIHSRIGMYVLVCLMARLTGKLEIHPSKMVASKWRLQSISKTCYHRRSWFVANLQLRRSILLALCQGHGKIHLLEFTQTIMQLPREVGHRSIIII